MTATPENATAVDVAAPRRDKARTRDAEDGWDNEGGHLPSSRPVSIIPSDASPVVRDQAAASAELAAMRAQFLADFAGGTMGRRHNTYQHRSRVLRQLADKPPQ